MARISEADVQGYCDPQFKKLKKQFISQINHFGGGAAASVYYQGEKVVDMWAGVAGNDLRPWQEDTLSLIWSTTKAVPSTLIHILASDGLIDYDAPVAKYWPEFAANGKQDITVRQLMSHQGGLYQMRGVIERPSDILDWELMIERLAAAKPLHKPGEANGYHALNIGYLLGAIIERVSGMPFKQFAQQRLYEPLRVKGLVIGAEDEHMPRIADTMGMPSIEQQSLIQQRYDVASYVPPGQLRRAASRGFTPQKLTQFLGDPAFYKAKVPAANGVFDARSLAKMYAMLANKGEFGGEQFVKPELINKAREVQTKRFDKVAVYPLHWRLGYHRADAITRNYPEAFGHYGLGGAGGWANPEKQLSFGLVHNSSLKTLLGHIRCIAISGAVYDGIK